ncbi:MAG: hypothetical protein Q7S64_01505 [bacterium]|nr:hypothetical protein [bacterium]
MESKVTQEGTGVPEQPEVETDLETLRTKLQQRLNELQRDGVVCNQVRELLANDPDVGLGVGHPKETRVLLFASEYNLLNQLLSDRPTPPTLELLGLVDEALTIFSNPEITADDLGNTITLPLTAANLEKAVQSVAGRRAATMLVPLRDYMQGHGLDIHNFS